MIDDRSLDDLETPLGTRWQAISDRVMGGVSSADAVTDVVDGRRCVRLKGDVSLANNGGFVQMAVNLRHDGGAIDARGYQGIRVLAYGNGECYSLHLRTLHVKRPWQSYRAEFIAPSWWLNVELYFNEFRPYRLNEPLDASVLRRIGVVARGREFRADVAIAHIALFPS